MATSPHIKYVDLFHRGYALLDIDHERTQTEWYHAESIVEANNTNQVMAAAFRTYDTNNYLVPATDGPSSKKPDTPRPAPAEDDQLEMEEEDEEKNAN